MPRRGVVLVSLLLASSALVSGYPGRVALPVRIADADVVGLLHVGDHVDLVAADPRSGTASYIAVAVPVLALPSPADQDVGANGLTGRLVVVAALPAEVDEIAGAVATGLLSVVLSG